uniref:Uncharacterized protein n=1 Tax=Anguilla anguilla TaxID=7936 RepID=A0A0E9QLK1_ANGAN
MIGGGPGWCAQRFNTRPPARPAGSFLTFRRGKANPFAKPGPFLRTRRGKDSLKTWRPPSDLDCTPNQQIP